MPRRCFGAVRKGRRRRPCRCLRCGGSAARCLVGPYRDCTTVSKYLSELSSGCLCRCWNGVQQGRPDGFKPGKTPSDPIDLLGVRQFGAPAQMAYANYRIVGATAGGRRQKGSGVWTRHVHCSRAMVHELDRNVSVSRRRKCVRRRSTRRTSRSPRRHPPSPAAEHGPGQHQDGPSAWPPALL